MHDVVAFVGAESACMSGLRFGLDKPAEIWGDVA